MINKKTFSKKGVELLKEFEDFRAAMYYDSAGLPTIGYGTLIDTPEEQIWMTEEITKEKAEELLLKDVSWAERDVNRFVKTELNQNQFDALVIFMYNIGSTQFRESSLLGFVNKDANHAMITYEWKKWIFSGGHKVDGLRNRRAKELALYFSNE